MPRLWTSVRPVADDDWAAVLELWQTATAEMPMAVDTLSRTTLERLRATLGADTVRTFVAVHDDAIVGLVVLTESPLTALTSDATMTVEVLYVLPAHRGRGVAAQLLARAATVADSLGASTVASTAPATAKSANRFYARLGFNAAVTRRVVATVALRRRLTTDVSPAGRIVARRRSLHARASQSRGLGAETLLPDASQRHAV